MTLPSIAARSLLPAALTVACLATSVRADDLTPPPWARYSAGTTFQHWDFSAGAGGGAPDAPAPPPNPFNPYGVPTLTPSAGAIWLAALGVRSDVWCLSGEETLTFVIPNEQDLHEKLLALQVTFLGTVA